MSAAHVSVRMYDVGLGDCFLLSFPPGPSGRRAKVLVDCGHHPAGPPEAQPFKAVVGQILSDIDEPGGPRLDVVVATHRHRDHVLGFEREEWAGVQVGEVWMPWTEHPTDPEARRIRNAQARKALAVERALAAAAGNDADAARARGLIDNTLKNAAAMATLHTGFTGVSQRRFLPELAETVAGPKTLVRDMAPGSLPGVTVHVLGPARDRDTIRDMDPPVGESFFRAAASGTDERGAGLDMRWALSARGKDFPDWWKRTEQAAKGISLDAGAPLSGQDPEFLLKWFRSLGLRLSDLKRIQKLASEEPLAAAVAIDQAVNGTSLMLAFEIGRAVLLFPGDAQWGTWRRAMADPRSRAVLERTTFLKVGHHGSHNATPQSFVSEVLGTDFQAMVSTRPTKLYKNIPRGPLLEALEHRQSTAALARSDVPAVAAPFVRVNPMCVEAKVVI